jgi:hypothetical protein
MASPVPSFYEVRQAEILFNAYNSGKRFSQTFLGLSQKQQCKTLRQSYGG